MTYEVDDQLGHNEETSQVGNRSNTVNDNTSMGSRNRTEEPDKELNIGSVPNMMYNEMKVKDKQIRDLESGKSVESRNQGAWSDSISDLTEESHYMRTQLIHNSDSQDMQLNQKNSEPNKNMSETSTSRKEVKVNFQNGEGHISRKASKISSTIKGDSHQGEKHTSIYINTTSSQKMEVSNKSGNTTNETITSEEDDETSCQVGNLVNTVSALTEGSHLMGIRITHGR